MCVCVCVCVCRHGHFKELSRCRLVGSCVRPGWKFFLRRPGKTTFARLTQPQATSQSIAFSSLSDQWEIRTSFTFFHFRISFFFNYRFLSHGDHRISWWRMCRWWGVNSKFTGVIPAWALTLKKASFGVCESRWSHQLTSDPRDVSFFWKDKTVLENALKLSPACVDLSETVKAVSVPAMRTYAFFMGGLRGFMHTHLLLKEASWHYRQPANNRWKNEREVWPG